MKLHRSQVSIGVECCDQQIRAVRITTTKKSIKINTMVVVDIAQRSQHNQLKALMKTHELLNYKNEPTIYAISHNDVITKKLSVDATLNNREIQKYLETQSSHIFAQSSNYLFFDFSRVGFTKKMQEILAVAARKEDINRIKVLFSRCRFRLKAVDVNILSIGRTLSYLSNCNSKANCLGVMTFYQSQLLFGAFYNYKNIYSVSIDYTGPIELSSSILSAINRALQFFKNANTNLAIDSIILMGESKHVSIAHRYVRSTHDFQTSLAMLNPNKICFSSFNKRLFASLGAALWGTSS